MSRLRQRGQDAFFEHQLFMLLLQAKENKKGRRKEKN